MFYIVRWIPVENLSKFPTYVKCSQTFYIVPEDKIY